MVTPCLLRSDMMGESDPTYKKTTTTSMYTKKANSFVTNSSKMDCSRTKISSIISVFVWFLLLVVFFACPVQSLDVNNFNEVNQTFRPGEAAQNLSMVRAHLMKINKPAFKTIQSPDGDIIDCVLSHEQPAFDHPQLKGQKPLDPPERSDGHNSGGLLSEDFQIWSMSGESCPEGTIPIRRTREDDVLRASSIRRFGRKLRRPIRRDSSSNGHEVSDRMQHYKNHRGYTNYHRSCI